MSFFGNSSRPERPDLKTTPAAGDTSNGNGVRPVQRSEATFLGDASQVTRTPPADVPPPTGTFSSDSRASAAASGPTPPERCTNVIAAGAKWKGTLTVDDSVRVDGIFSGEIQSKGTVHVAEGAQVDAKIRAAFVVVAGTFRGEVRCDQRVDLLPRSRVNGEVITKVLSVHEGAVLDGRVQMTGSEAEASPRLSARTAAARAASSLDVDAQPADDRERATTVSTPASSNNSEA